MIKNKNWKKYLVILLASGLFVCSNGVTVAADETDIMNGMTVTSDGAVSDSGDGIGHGVTVDSTGDPVVIQPVKNPTPAINVSIVNKIITNIPYGGEISLNGGVTWSMPINSGSFSLSDSAISMLHSGSVINAVLPGDDIMTLDSDIQTVKLTDADFPTPVIIPTKLPTPNAVFEASTMIISGIPSPGAYSVDGGNNWINSSGSFPITNVSANYDILVKALGDDITTVDSDNQTIYITKADTPNGVATNPVTTAGGTGSIVHVSPGMEYRASGSSNWIDINDSTVSGLPGGNYDVRVSASGTMLASDFVTVTIDVIPMGKADTPNASFDGASMILSNLGVGMAISYNGGSTWETITDNHCTHVTLTTDQANQSISYSGIRVKRLGDGQTKLDSDVQTVSISRAATPSGISATAATNGANGVIRNVSTDMQYLREGTNAWIDIGSNTISGLVPGTYDIRRKASGSMMVSSIYKIAIGSSTPTPVPVTPTGKESTPSANFNAQNMVLSNVNGVKYSTDGQNFSQTITSDNIQLDERTLHTDKGIRLYRQGNGSTTKDSDVQYIELKRQPTPSGISAISATAGAGGIINGVNKGMEYKAVNANTWTNVGGNSITGLAEGTYYIRTIGAYQNLPSEAISVVINKTAAPAIVVPTPVPTSTSTNTSAKTTSDSASKKDTATTEKTQAELDAEKKAEEATEAEQKQAEAADDTQTTEDATVPITTEEPVLASAPTQKGWGAIEAGMNSNEPTAVVMNGSTQIPGSVLVAAKNAGSELILGMSNDVVWSIDTSAVSDDISDIDMGVVENTKNIPQKLISDASSEGIVDKQFDINHEGDFGFNAKLTIKLSADASDKFANLLYYNKTSQAMECIASCSINEKNEATFPMTHASSYAVVVTDKEMQRSAAVTDGSQSKAVKTETKTSPWVWIIVAGAVLTIIAVSAIIYMRRRQALEDARRRHNRQVSKEQASREQTSRENWGNRK